MSIVLVLISFLTSLFLAAGPVRAAEKLVFDSTNNYIGGCQLTNKSEWELKSDLTVTTFQIWYSWNSNETTLPVKVYRNKEVFAEFSATRSACDPYQKQWCNADYKINKLFPKGSYSTEIAEARQCLKPGGTGTVRLYANDSPEKTPEVTPTPSPTPTPALTPIIKSKTEPGTPVCPCNQTTVIVIAVAASALSSLLFTLLFKKLLPG